jgi:antitoxin VapB
MALNIRNPEAERLAVAVAKLAGETKTEAVTRVLRDRLARLRRERVGRRLADELDEIALHCASLPVKDDRAADEILGYDENGLPGWWSSTPLGCLLSSRMSRNAAGSTRR